MGWRDDPIVEPAGGIGISVPPQQGMQVSPADQAQRDKARLAILEDETKANPNDPALTREVAAERQKQGAAAPPARSWRDDPIVESASQPKQPTLKRAMQQQTAEGGIANAFNTGIANASSRVVGPILRAILPENDVALAEKQGLFPSQRNIDLLEAGTEGSIPARTGQVAMDVVASAPAALKAAKLVPATAPLRVRGAAALAGETAANAGYGALTADEGQAGQGAAWGAGGTLVGHALGRTVGGLIKPTDEAQRLMAEGIQPTAGQAMGPNSWLQRGENYLAKMPIAGASIRSTREKALQDFQAATRKAASPTGEAADTLADLSKAYNSAYDDLVSTAQFGSNPQLPTVPDIINSIGRQVQPSTKEKAASMIKDVIAGMEDNSPAAYHWAERRLKDIAFRYKSSASATEQEFGGVLADAARVVHDTWRPALEGGVQTALSSLDQQYAKFVPIRRAGTTGVGTLDTPESYSPKALLQALRQGDKSVNNSQFLKGNLPQQQLAADAQKVLGSTVPKTTEGGIAALLAGGGTAAYTGMGIPAALGAGGAYLAGTRPAQRFLTGDYPAQRAVAEVLRRGAAPAALAASRKKRDE